MNLKDEIESSLILGVPVLFVLAKERKGSLIVHVVVNGRGSKEITSIKYIVNMSSGEEMFTTEEDVGYEFYRDCVDITDYYIVNMSLLDAYERWEDANKRR